MTPRTYAWEGGDTEVPPPNNPNVVRAVLQVSRDTRAFVNTLHVVKEVPGPWTLSDMGEVGDIVQDWWITRYRQYVSTALAAYNVHVVLYDPTNPLVIDQPIVPPSPGLLGLETEPGNVTAVISWRTGLAGRKYRGRIYTVGITVNNVDELDRLSANYVTGMGLIAQYLITALESAGYRLAIFHRDDNTFTVSRTFVIENLADSQRRRLPGRGR